MRSTKGRKMRDLSWRKVNWDQSAEGSKSAQQQRALAPSVVISHHRVDTDDSASK